MDIHKPRAAHSLVEFLIEIGTITCGIAIALAGEQAVEALHWRHVSGQTQELLNEEIRGHLGYARYRLAFDPCIADRMAHLRDRLVTSKGDWTGDPAVGRRFEMKGAVKLETTMPSVIELPFYAYPQQAWDAARTNTALDHLERKRLSFYSVSNTVVSKLAAWQAQEKEAALDLAPLAFDGHLGDDQRARYLQALARLDDAASHEVTFSRILLTFAQAQGLRPDEKETAQSVAQARKAYGACVR